MIFLQRLHGTKSVPCGGDALDSVVGTGEGRDVRNLVLDSGLADGAFVLDGVALCPRRVDDQVHLLVQDDVENVRAAFSNLVHHFALHAGLLVELGGAFGSVNLEAELLEFLADFDGLFRQVNFVREANQHGTFVREEGTCGFLALVVSEGVVVGEAEHFTRGAHFGAENRVHLRELVEGEHSFLGAVVVELLVLELQVFELGTEHQAGSEAGHLGVANLGDQRHRAGGTRVRFEHEHLAVFDSVLHVHEAAKPYKARAAKMLAFSLVVSMLVAMPLSGIGMPSWSIILRNRSRSSAISMESMLVPRIFTPSSERARAMFSGEIIWAFPHIYVRSGYILGATTFASLVTRLLKRNLAPENIRTKSPASLRPKESLSLTQRIIQ